jgi:hypothetical protein
VSDSITLDDVNVTAPAPTQQRSGASSPYAVRILTPTFVIGSGGSPMVKQGLRVIAQISDAQIPSGSSLLMTVYGMTLSEMNALTVAGLSYLLSSAGANANHVSLAAGDAASGMTTVFTGLITDAYPDGKQPNMGFVVKASSQPGYTMPPAQPTSFNGSVSVETMMTQIGQQAGLSVQNNGVTAVMSNRYFAGSVMDQIKDCAEAADCFAKVDAQNKQIMIAPKGSGNTQSGGVVFSPANEMIGYPSFENAYVTIRSVFDPSRFLTSMQPYKIEGSQFTAANGSFYCVKVDYDLASQMPGGPWEMVVKGYPATGAATGIPVNAS